MGVPPFLKISHNDVWGNNACIEQRGMIHYIGDREVIIA